MHTEETKKKMRKAKENYVPWNVGIPHSKETKKKISEANRKRYIKNPHLKKQIADKLKGDKSHLWKGGISDSPYSDDWIEALREAIRQRDDYVCQMCGIHQEELNGRFKRLDVHHIDYDKENCNPDNLVALCRSCHVKTNYKRGYWKECLKRSFKLKLNK